MPPKTYIKIAAEQWIPWTKFTELENGSVKIGGPMGKLLDIFAERMNLEYEMIRPPDSHWGIKLSDGSWNGMMGMVYRNEVEFALGPFAVTAQREDAVDFSMAVHSDNQAIIMVRPGLASDMLGFLKPFTVEVWLLMVISMICISGAMVFTVRGEGKIFNSTPRNIISKTCAWVLQTLTQESSEWLPQGDGGRYLVTTWLLASLVFMSSYSGILTAMLTVPRVTIPIDSLADLVSQSDLPWRLESGAMMLTYLQESEDQVRQMAYAGMSGTVPDCWSRRDAVVNGEFAVICDETTMKKAISWDFSTSGECHLYIARERVFSNIMMSLAFKVNSSYINKANEIIQTLRSAGIISKWLGTEVTNTSQCLRPPSSDRRSGIEPLSLDSFLGPVLSMAAGLTLSLLVFCCESLSCCGSRTRQQPSLQ
ncbi:glutamate receptor-like [Panulirus ornatus]|uniref:glutamate receptor-like n=1 Tax=Panulirus ornatus TaxID=150431 RepID=UPI003A86CA83